MLTTVASEMAKSKANSKRAPCARNGPGGFGRGKISPRDCSVISARHKSSNQGALRILRRELESLHLIPLGKLSFEEYSAFVREKNRLVTKRS